VWHWRSLLLRSVSRGSGSTRARTRRDWKLTRLVVGCEDLEPTDRARVEAHLAEAFEMILRPWLTGQLALDYERVRGLCK